MQQLKAKNNKLEYWLNQAKREICDQKMQLIFARDKLRGENQVIEPVVDDGMTECPECCAPLKRDFSYCPICGKLINWHAIETDVDEARWGV